VAANAINGRERRFPGVIGTYASLEQTSRAPISWPLPLRLLGILLTATASYYLLEKPCIELGKRVSKYAAARSKRSQPIQITSNDLVMAAQQPNPAKMID
jgi:hypothetical protein